MIIIMMIIVMMMIMIIMMEVELLLRAELCFGLLARLPLRGELIIAINNSY